MPVGVLGISHDQHIGRQQRRDLVGGRADHHHPRIAAAQRVEGAPDPGPGAGVHQRLRLPVPAAGPGRQQQRRRLRARAQPPPADGLALSG